MRKLTWVSSLGELLGGVATEIEAGATSVPVRECHDEQHLGAGARQRQLSQLGAVPGLLGTRVLDGEVADGGGETAGACRAQAVGVGLEWAEAEPLGAIDGSRAIGQIETNPDPRPHRQPTARGLDLHTQLEFVALERPDGLHHHRQGGVRRGDFGDRSQGFRGALHGHSPRGQPVETVATPQFGVGNSGDAGVALLDVVGRAFIVVGRGSKQFQPRARHSAVREAHEGPVDELGDSKRQRSVALPPIGPGSDTRRGTTRRTVQLGGRDGLHRPPQLREGGGRLGYSRRGALAA